MLAIIDKIEREPEESLNARLTAHTTTVAALREFIAAGSPEHFAPLLEQLDARGLREFVEIDLSIVRGLAYYTGVVFEAFDRSKSMRALAGGGRYDNLLSDLSDGAVKLPAIGFAWAMSCLEISSRKRRTPSRKWSRARRRPRRGGLCRRRRRGAPPRGARARAGAARRGLAHGFPARRGEGRQAIPGREQLGARFAAVVGGEWPAVKVKTLATRAETTVPHETLADWLKTAQP